MLYFNLLLNNFLKTSNKLICKVSRLILNMYSSIVFRLLLFFPSHFHVYTNILISKHYCLLYFSHLSVWYMFLKLPHRKILSVVCLYHLEVTAALYPSKSLKYMPPVRIEQRPLTQLSMQQGTVLRQPVAQQHRPQAILL